MGSKREIIIINIKSDNMKLNNISENSSLKTIVKGLVVTASFLICMSCTKYDDYLKYVKDGEIVYPQKADSVKSFPGKNRVLLQWLTLDPRVTEFKVTYGYAGELDSVQVPASHTDAYSVDTVRTVINGLDETNYTFRIVSQDAYGNKSLVVEADEMAYGELYEAGLYNRQIKSKTVSNDGVEITWFDAAETEVGVDLTYTATDLTVKTVRIPQTETVSLITDLDTEYPFSYKTLYKPTENAIDVFETKEQKDSVVNHALVTRQPSSKVNKSK
jgi:hypothetical protein